MEKSIRLNKATSWYLFLLIAWIVCTTLALCMQSKPALFLAINHYRNSVLDIVATVFTCIGDGLFTLTLCAFFVFAKNRRLAWVLLCSFLLSALFCGILKNIADELRPAGYFKDTAMVKSVSWVSLKRFNSFPSGHTTSAFATATVLAFYYKKVWLSFLFFLFALLVGYSRIYLGEHFVSDVFMGAIIGTLSSVLCILNHRSPVIRKGLGLEYLFKKKGMVDEQKQVSIF